MKVLLLAESMPDYAVEFANALAGCCEAALLMPERVLEPYRRWLAPKLDAPALDWPRLRSPRNALFVTQLLSLIRAARPDIIHVLSQTLTWPALILPLRGPTRLIETVHDVTVHPGDAETQRIPQHFTRLLRSQADALIVHADGLRAAARALTRGAHIPVFVLPHLALQRYARLAKAEAQMRKDDRFDILFFGRIYRYKGLDLLIAAAERLKAHIPNLRITIAGQGDDLARCRGLIRTPELFDIREGVVPDEEVAALFARTDLVALPYIEASQSGVMAIAFAFGKAVVASDVGDFAEALGGPDPAGLIVPASDAEALAGAIARLYSDAPLRARFGEAGLRLARGTRGADAIGQAALRIYEDVCDRSHADRAA